MPTNSIVDRLIEKAQEAFIVAIELYNKPTIKYRVEGFSFFICNAWELMLKAYLIKNNGEESIYYKDSQTRTISIENCIQKVFTNEKAPLRLNLEQIIELRNTGVHFIIEEYEQLYAPLFQACIFNFINKMNDFHNIDITELIPSTFLTLPVRMESVTETALRGKYPRILVDKFFSKAANVTQLIENNNSNFAIQIQHTHFITKKKEEATSLVHISNDAETGVQILKELKDPNLTHKYNMKNAIKEINSRLKKSGIVFYFNKYMFNLFNKKYHIKENNEYCYIHKQNQNPSYSYSIKVIDLIVNMICQNPENFESNLKK